MEYRAKTNTRARKIASVEVLQRERYGSVAIVLRLRLDDGTFTDTSDLYRQYPMAGDWYVEQPFMYEGKIQFTGSIRSEAQLLAEFDPV